MVNETQINTTTITDYLNGFQYKNNVLQYFPTTEGYVNFVLDPVIEDKGKYSYVYNYTDHLGNIRLSYALNPVGNALTIVEENHYYPFGLKHANYNSGKQIFEIELAQLKLKPSPPYFRNGNNYKYNGKELQEELGLNVYDYGARNYMPDIGRWGNIDPLAEISRKWSLYNYCMNNPIFFVDPDGMRTIPPLGLDRKDGTIHTDSDGSWKFNEFTNVWVGQEGSEDIMNAVLLDDVAIQGSDKWDGTYFDKDNYGKGANPYSPYSSSTPALILCGFLAAPIALEMGGTYLAAELAGYSSVTAETAIAGIATNTLSQGIANGGDFTQVNSIEAISSAVPGIGPTIFGETFSYNYNDWYSGNGIQTPKSYEHGILQIGGGLLSNKFGNKIDSNPFFASGVGKTYGKAAAFAVETGSNVLPSLADKTQQP